MKSEEQRTRLENALKYRAVILGMADWIEGGKVQDLDLLIEERKRQLRQELRSKGRG